MSFIRPDKRIQLLVVVGGHPFDRTAFAELLDGFDDIAATFVDQPAAMDLLNPHGLRHYDGVLFYDVPGIDLWGGVTRQQPVVSSPPAALADGFAALLEQGIGMIFLHHAIAGWPEWDDYANAIGGRFQYLSGTLNGHAVADSGYAQNVTYTARNIAADHPVMRGIPPEFTLTDELYLYEVNHGDIVPLMVADYPFDQSRFFSAEAAVARGRMFCNENWAHPVGSNALAWVKTAGQSPILYIQPGDTPDTYGNPHYRRLLENGVHWAVSDEARAWARSRTGQAQPATADGAA